MREIVFPSEDATNWLKSKGLEDFLPKALRCLIPACHGKEWSAVVCLPWGLGAPVQAWTRGYFVYASFHHLIHLSSLSGLFEEMQASSDSYGVYSRESEWSPAYRPWVL